MAQEKIKTVVELAGAVHPSLAKSIQTAQKALGGIDIKAAATGAAIAAAAVVAVKAVASISNALINLEDEFGTAYDAIRAGTGATGDALRALEGDCKEVFKAMPVDVKTAGEAIADYNTRLGLSGDAVQELSKQAIALNKILGTDVPAVTEASSLAFQQWSIANEQMGESFDYAFKVSQATGVEITKLLGDVTRFGPAFQELGYSFEESAALIGKITKAGYNADEVMAAMKKSIGALAKEGIDAAEGFQYYYDHIKNAKDATQATQYAMEIFGARGGASMAAAIRSGALEISDFTKELENNSESIMGAYKDIEGLPEYIMEIQNRVKASFEPMAIAYVKILESIMPPIMDVIDKILPLFEKIPDFIKATLDKLQPVLQPISDLFTEEIFPLISDVIKSLLPVFNTLQETLGPVIDHLLPVLGFLISVSINSIRILCGVIGGALVNALNIVTPIFDNIMVILTGIIDFLLNVFTLQWGAAWQNIVDIFGATFGLIGNLAKAPINVVIGLINSVISGINAMKIEIPEWIPKLGGQSFELNIPQIPMLASGGFTEGISIAGEEGQEAVISFDPAYRNRNIDIWREAGDMLGVSSNEEMSTVTFGDIIFAPQISTVGNETMTPENLLNKIYDKKSEFIDFIESELYMRAKKAYGGNY